MELSTRRCNRCKTFFTGPGHRRVVLGLVCHTCAEWLGPDRHLTGADPLERMIYGDEQVTSEMVVEYELRIRERRKPWIDQS